MSIGNQKQIQVNSMCDNDARQPFYNKLVIDLEILRQTGNRELEHLLEKTVIELSKVKVNDLYIEVLTWER